RRIPVHVQRVEPSEHRSIRSPQRDRTVRGERGVAPAPRAERPLARRAPVHRWSRLRRLRRLTGTATCSEHGEREQPDRDRTLAQVIVAHLDLDAFFAAVEELEEPRYRTIPLIVGGDPRGRGVVATANYVARGFGIHSAMSCAEALRRCPHATFVRPRHTLYRDYSREVWSTVREIVPAVEQAGIDEGYLDLEEVAPAFDDARSVAEAVRAVVPARSR